MGASLASAGGSYDESEGGIRLVSGEHVRNATHRWAAQRRWSLVAKRILDILGASVGLAIASPLLAIAAVAIKIESHGHPIFRQQRLGLRGQPFTMFKLRTMVVNNDDSAHRKYVAALMNGEGTTHDGIYKLTKDPRLTRVGKFLRSTSVDEIPQLVNVIRGEMSLVGPRPPLPAEVDMYDEQDWGRLSQRPGITGLWQVSGRCELTYRQMIELDLEYVSTWSIWLDLRILLRTPRAILSRRGAA